MFHITSYESMERQLNIHVHLKKPPPTGEHSSQYKFYLCAQTRLKPRWKLKHLFQFPSQCQSRPGSCNVVPTTYRVCYPLCTTHSVRRVIPCLCL